MIEILASLCASVAVWWWLPSRSPAERLVTLRSDDRQPSTKGTSSDEGQPRLSPGAPAASASPRRTLVTAACAGLFAGFLVGGGWGVAAGAVVFMVAGVVLHRHAAPDQRRDRERIAADLPFAADLMVACLQAGQPVSAATEIAATAVGGPLGQKLSWVSGQLRLGADPEAAWRTLAGDAAMGRLSRAMSRAAQSGAPVADVLTRVADDARQAAQAASVAAARRVGVLAVAPLGLCFLPAFVFLGIIPVVAGLARNVLIP